MMLPRRGWAICLLSTPSTAFSLIPSARGVRNASSRFGPWVPLVLARASVWQEPHWLTKAVLPLARSASLRPHAESTSALAASAAVARTVLRNRCKAAGRLAATGAEARQGGPRQRRGHRRETPPRGSAHG